MADRSVSELVFEKIDSSLLFGWTSFLIHVRNGDVCIVQKLIAEGHCTNDCNGYGLDALTISVISTDERMVETILNAPDFNYDLTVRKLIDPLSLASLLGYQSIVRILLDKLPCLVNNVTPFSGFTPIFFAGIKRHYKIVEILIERGANLRLKNSAQQTLIEVATMMSDAELVSLLMAKSGIDDLSKPRCHPRLYTPPRCLRVSGVSPQTPKMMNIGLKTPKQHSKVNKTGSETPLSSRKAAKPLRQINDNLPDESFDLSNNSFLPNSSIQTDSSEFSYSLCSDDFTPMAKSSMAFTRSMLSENFSFNSNNSSYCITPKLLTYSHSSSPYPSRVCTASPKMPSPGRSYYHFPSPHYLQTPLANAQNLVTPQINLQFPTTPKMNPKFPVTPQTSPKFPQTPQMNKMDKLSVSWHPQVRKTNFLTPQNVNRHHRASKSFVDSFVTPLKNRTKKESLRTKLLDKLYKREKPNKNDENQCLEQQDCDNGLENVLEFLGLQKYHSFFEMNEVEPEILPTFTDSDLRSMGIADKKVRKLILKKIRKKLL